VKADDVDRLGLRALSESPPALADYLEAVRAFLTKYVVFASNHEPLAIALWVAHCYRVDDFEVSPLLAVTSAEMRSGKTRVLDVLELLVPRPWRSVIPSAAVVYTILARRPRWTLLLDEADTIFGPRTSDKHEDLRAILNAGNRQGTPVMRVRLDGKRREAEEFDIFGPKVAAGIGDLPPTVTDRAIVIRMRRRAPSEPIAKFRTRSAREEAGELPVLDWGALEIETTADVPDDLNDRAADSWEPLLAIAAAAGGSWPAAARLAAVSLATDEEVPVSIGMRLLADIREAFGVDDHVPTNDLLARLHDLDEAPWADWYGKPLTARALARLLGPYRIVPVKRRLAGTQLRGYFRSDFSDAWDRYVPVPVSGPVPSVPTVSNAHGGTDGPDGTGPRTGNDEDYPSSALWTGADE
jgi:hypothetical protein